MGSILFTMVKLYAGLTSPMPSVKVTHLCTRFATPVVEDSLPKVLKECQLPVRPATPHFSVNSSSALHSAMGMKPGSLTCAKAFDTSSIVDVEMNAELLSSDKTFRCDPLYRSNCFVYKDSDSEVDPIKVRLQVWENYLHEDGNKPYYQIYPKFDYRGEIYVWQAKAYHDGHLFLIAIRKYCLDRYHKSSSCLSVLRTSARIILNIYQGYYRSLGSTHNYCKLKFLKHFVSHFDDNLKIYRNACKKNGRFIPHGTFMESLETAREEDTWGASLVSLIANWDVTKNFLKNGIKNYASGVVTEYADRCSILADILNAANTLYKNLIAFKVGDVSIDQILLSINSFYRSLDFTNPWAKRLRSTLASIFPSFETVCDNASRLRELINYLIDGCSQKFKDMFESISTLVNGFGTAVDPHDPEDHEHEHGRFYPFGPFRPILDICDSDLGFMAAKLTTLVASFCAIMTVDGKVPELSYEGLSKFSTRRVLPIMLAGIIAGKTTGYLADFDKVLSLMWQAVDSIFKGDFGRFVGVDSYSQIFELYSFVATSYGGIPPTQDTLSYSDRDHYKCPVSRMLPMSIVSSSDPDWQCMIDDLEGILPGHATAPKDWSNGMKVVTSVLNAKLQRMVSKVSLTKEMQTKFTNITTHLQALTRNVSTLPSPHKASGMSFVFTGNAGIGKSNALGNVFIKTVTQIIHSKAYKFGYPDIGNWKPGDPIDQKCIDKQRRSNYMLNKQGGVTFLYSHVEDFDPCEMGPVPPENNMVHRIMLTGDGVSANQEAAALESRKGDGVKGDNHYRILAGFYSDNRSDAGIQELAVCTPAVVRRTIFIEWHLKGQYADPASKLDVDHPTVIEARNASDTSSIYNLVSVYTFVRLSSATGEFKRKEQMSKVPVSYTFKEDRSYGAGRDAKFFAKGTKIVLSKVTINTFYCYIHDMVEHKYETSFRAWRSEEIKSSLKSESCRCACPNCLTVRHCPVCAGIHEFDSYTGDLVVMSPRIRYPTKANPNPTAFGKFTERSIIMSLRKVDRSMIQLFPVLIYSATLRPVTQRIFEAFPFNELTAFHKDGSKWLFAERGGAFIESSALDYLLGISAGVIYYSADCLEEWWKKEFDTDYSLAQMYFFLLRYIIFTPSEFSDAESVENTSVISELQNVSLELLWQSSKVSGVDCNGAKLIDRVRVNSDSIHSNTARDVCEMNTAKATYISLAKCLVFQALLSDKPNIGSSHFDFFRGDFDEIASSFFSVFDTTPSDYFESFISVFVPNTGASLVFDHKPIVLSKRKDVLCNHAQVCSRVFKDEFWNFDFGPPKENASSFQEDGRSGLYDFVTGFKPFGVDEVKRREFYRAAAIAACLLVVASKLTRYRYTQQVIPRISNPPPPPSYSEVLESYDNPHSDIGEDEDDQDCSLSWVCHVDLDCCKGVEVRRMDGSVATYHHPKCTKCGPWCEKVFLHLDRDPSSLDASSEFVETVKTRSRDRDWVEAADQQEICDAAEDDFNELSDLCPMTCCQNLWDSSFSCVIPVLSPSKNAIAISVHRFHGFLKNLRNLVRQSCFIEIPKISIKAILYTLSPIIAAGAFYPIFYKVLTAGDENTDGFTPNGVQSKIPDGENYWSEKSLVKNFLAKEVHNASNTSKTSHGSTLKSAISSIFGHNKNCCTSRVVKLKRRNPKNELERSSIHGFCFDNKSVLVPSHFFSGVDLNEGIGVSMTLTLTGKDGQASQHNSYDIKVNNRNVYFDSKLDLCRIAHGVSGISGLKEFDASYNSDFYCSVGVDGTYWHPSPSGLVQQSDGFFNRNEEIAFFGKDAVNYPDSKDIMEHLRGKPMDGLLVRSSKDGDHRFKNGDCGLPALFSDKGRFPVLGLYIGNYDLDQVCYNCYVPLTKKFVVGSNEALFQLTKPGVTKASTIGSFKRPKGRFTANMDRVLESDLDDPSVQEELANAKRISGSKVRRTDQRVEWSDFLQGCTEDKNVAEQTELFRFSDSKSGIHVSLPSFDSTKVKGIYPNHEKVRGIFPVIGSDNDVYFYPDFLYLGATPWMGDENPHPTFSGELPVGMVGPGVKDSNGSMSSMSLDKEVAKCMIHGHIDHDLVHEASSRIYEHYFNVIQGLLNHDAEGEGDDSESNSVHEDLVRLLNTTIEEQFVGVKNDDGTVIMPKMDHTSSWGSNFKPPRGSGKRDVYEISDDGELLIYDSAVPAWEAFTAAVFCFTCGVVPENQVTTCFTKRECYPVTMSAKTNNYPVETSSREFYSALIGEDKARELLDTDPGDDQKIRDIFHSVDNFKVKVKSRMVSNLPGAVNVAFRMFLLPLAYLFTNNPIEFDMVAGLDMGSCHFEQSTNQIFFDGYDEQSDKFLVFDADVSAWDKIMPANLTKYTLTICIELVLAIHEYFGTYSPRLKAYADALLEWWDDMTLFYGGTVIPISVMPSGFIFTLPLNSMMNQVLKICNVLKFARDHDIPFPSDFTDWVRHKALGDDSQTAIKPAFVEACKLAGAPVYSAVDYSEIMRGFGITATMGDKSDTSLPYQKPGDLVFLQHVMVYIEIPAYSLDEIMEDPTRIGQYVLVGAAPLKASVLVKLLAKQDSSSSVEHKDLLRSQVYTVLGELVPYGRIRWQRFVDAVKKYYHPTWKPKAEDHEYFKYWSWNFWLDRYVKKFCKNGLIDDFIIHQRSSNPKAFESLKRQINPDGFDRLVYDSISH